MDFHERLKIAIEQKGYSLDELAAKSGVSANSIRNWKNGYCAPSFFCVMWLAEVLEVSLDWLAWGRE